jgi:autotransporter family porin
MPASPRRTGVRALAAAALLTLAAPTISLGSPVAVAAEATSGGFTTSGAATPASGAVGRTVSVVATVEAASSRRALVDLEIYDRSGNKVFQRYWDNASFQAGVDRSFSVNWRVPSNGTFTVKVGVFRTGWGTLLHWNNDAARVTASSTTPTVPPTTTQPPVPTTQPPVTSTQPPSTTTTTTTTTSPPTTTPPGSGRFATLPPGSALPSGAQCAARVRPAVEIRPENAAANALRGSRANANTRSDWSGFNRVDGDFAGTTDEIIQWAACKWGIDEDIVRAQVIKESYWYQSANGDNGESWGLGQVRVPYHQSAFQYAVNARTSSAYNLDYTYASWRACYEGVYTWLNTVERGATYGPGDVWGCVGVWFSGRWYLNDNAYLNQTGDSVRWHYNNKTWTTPAFING